MWAVGHIGDSTERENGHFWMYSHVELNLGQSLTDLEIFLKYLFSFTN